LTTADRQESSEAKQEDGPALDAERIARRHGWTAHLSFDFP
jgi:hypothetical protein